MNKNCSMYGSSWCADFDMCEECPIDPHAHEKIAGVDIPMIKAEGMEDALVNLERVAEMIDPSDPLTVLDRSRPYNGQPWTATGERGKQEVKGVTMRDIRDCFIRACFECNPHEGEVPESVYHLDWGHIDPMAIAQSLGCWIERYMGIFPNVPKLREIEPERCGAYAENWKELGKPEGWLGCSLPKGHGWNHSDEEGDVDTHVS